VQFTFLNGRTYYTISSLIEDSAQVFFARAGANDPNFNLRNEPSYIIRKKGTNRSFVNVVEIHGSYDPIGELSANSYPAVKQIRVLQQDENNSIISVMIDGKELIVAQKNRDLDSKAENLYSKDGKNITWTGNWVVLYDGRQLR
jgi:hypothetical protein